MGEEAQFENEDEIIEAATNYVKEFLTLDLLSDMIMLEEKTKELRKDTNMFILKRRGMKVIK